jgi:hypothetical protein
MFCKEMRMKKFGIAMVLAAAGAAAASGVFAQEIKFDGYFNSGVGLILSNRREIRDGNEETVEPRFKAFGVDSEQWGYRFRLNGSFINKDENAGVKFRIQSQSRTDRNGWIGLPYAYGWVSFFDKKFTLNGGIVDNGTWSSGGILDEDQGEGLGILASASPIQGLDLGVGAYLISTQGGSNNNSLFEDGDGLINFGEVNISPENIKYTFNAGYTMPDLFKLSATYRLKNKAGGAGHTSYAVSDYQYGGRDESSRAIIAARLFMVKNLTAIVEAEIDKIENFDTLGKVNLFETLGYNVGNLSVGLNMVQYLTRNEKADDPGLRFNPWVSYAVRNIVPRLDLVYFNAGTLEGVSSTSDDWKYYRKGYAVNNNKDYHTLTARPSAKINLDSKTFLEIGDAVSYIIGPDKSFAQAGNPDNNTRLINVVYVDFKWSF